MNMCVRFQNYSEFPNNSYIIHSGQVLRKYHRLSNLNSVDQFHELCAMWNDVIRQYDYHVVINVSQYDVLQSYCQTLCLILELSCSTIQSKIICTNHLSTAMKDSNVG